jgi:ATP-dependent protease HslVU (ClpYQ) peptidase subunit
MATNNAINSPLPTSLALGGTNAALTASNGGIFYSTASAGAILAGTATANQILLSGSSTTPAWSTATYPATTTINQLLYSSANNVIGGVTTANNGSLVTSNTGVPSIQTLTAGQILIGTTGAAPTATTLTAGTGISISSASGSITISSSALSTNWVNQTTSVTMAIDTSYFANSASLVTFTLPATCAQGVEFAVAGVGSGGWKIAQAASQFINFGNVVTTTGTGGSLASSNQYDVVYLVCTAANTQFSVLGSVGNLTYV